MTKEEKKDEMKNRISMALKNHILQQGFEIICKNLADLEQENNKLLDVINNQDVKIADLEKQIEKMKICPNCKFEDNDYMEKPCCECSRCLGDIKRKGASDKWEIKENDKRYM